MLIPTQLFCSENKWLEIGILFEKKLPLGYTSEHLCKRECLSPVTDMHIQLHKMYIGLPPSLLLPPSLETFRHMAIVKFDKNLGTLEFHRLFHVTFQAQMSASDSALPHLAHLTAHRRGTCTPQTL